MAAGIIGFCYAWNTYVQLDLHCTMNMHNYIKRELKCLYTPYVCYKHIARWKSLHTLCTVMYTTSISCVGLYSS